MPNFDEVNMDALYNEGLITTTTQLRAARAALAGEYAPPKRRSNTIPQYTARKYKADLAAARKTIKAQKAEIEALKTLVRKYL